MKITLSSDRVVTTGGKKIITLHVNASEPITQFNMTWEWDDRLGHLLLSDDAARWWKLDRGERSGEMIEHQLTGTFPQSRGLTIPFQVDIPNGN